jgi:putative phosphoesterase
VTHWCFHDVPSSYRQIALLGDIHANGPALAAVLAELPSNAFVVCLGDLVGYYTEPDEVCRAIRSRANLAIRGNHDAYAIKALEYSPDREAAYRMQWTRGRLSSYIRNWLEQLPTSLAIRSTTGTFFVRHANLLDEIGYVYPDTTLEDVQLNSNEILVLGHTHHPMVRKGGKGWVVNPGSVGQPRDGRPGAAYALIDITSHQITFRRAEYDVASYQKRLREYCVDELYVRMLDRSHQEGRRIPADEGANVASYENL